MAGLEKGSGWDEGVLSFGSLWKIPSEGVEEDGVGNPVRFTLHHWQSHIPQNKTTAGKGQEKWQQNVKLSPNCWEWGCLQECCPGGADGEDPPRLPCAVHRNCCILETGRKNGQESWKHHLSWKFLEILRSQTSFSPLNPHCWSEGCCDWEITGAEA